jgi:hypothetical protein
MDALEKLDKLKINLVSDIKEAVELIKVDKPIKFYCSDVLPENTVIISKDLMDKLNITSEGIAPAVNVTRVF